MRKGAMTVEAALVLPLLLCAFLSIVFIIKAVYAYELINHALNETASEIASSSYIYNVSGLRDLHDTVRNGMNDKSEVFAGQIGSVFDTFNSLKSVKRSMGQGLQGVEDSAALLQDADRSFSDLINSAKATASDPLEELKSIVCYIARGTFDDVKTQLFTPVVKLYMRKYFITEDIKDADQRLKLLNIEEGFSGLDFSESSFLSDRDENIDIVVQYTIRLPLPVQFIHGLNITQRVKVKAWMSGDEFTGVLKGSQNTEALWTLSNFQRGLKIRRAFGGNLPSNYPVIASFKDGKAVMIKSVDLTAQSYQKGDNAQKLINEYIDVLAEFKGTEKPWGSENIIIRERDIKNKELLLVIPEDKLSQSNEALLASLVYKAESKGISLVIKRYGLKANETGVGKDAGEDTGQESAGKIQEENDGGTAVEVQVTTK